ncbi:MAG TPA: N-acetyl-gamma-glutamyl-phosphate reductase [Polyangia bacterium]|jgi:N-acetyl-gamma-glutamyl-phosphate reductase|nr:N-acetyl-gamma-glutamyl-phosphate reductase [Polyangia bacterium]
MNSQVVRVGIVGVSGYAGMELGRILSGHPGFAVRLVISDKWAGRALGDCLSVAGSLATLTVQPQAEATKQLNGLDLVFFCTPAEVSLALAPAALDAGARVVDLSGAFRLKAADFPRWYGFEHTRPDLLAEAVYSMPEVTGDETTRQLRSARLVSNPGCYPTASALAVLPLLRAGVIEPTGIIVDAKSGTTGAGRKATEEMSFSETDGDFRAYRVLRHQHTPEIERALALAGAPVSPMTFTAHLLPTRRGILATAYGRLRAGKAAADAAAAVQDFVRGRAFLRATKPDAVRLHAVISTNRVLLGADADPERGIAVGFGAIDNLVKGAAGQAVQNANLMFGFEETTGLLGLAGSTP